MRSVDVPMPSISVTSAGQISPAGSPPYFVVIDRALRDEGTSYHYAAPDTFAEADPHIVELAMRAIQNVGLRAYVGPSWTTDAPFRETAEAIAAATGAAASRILDRERRDGDGRPGTVIGRA